MNFQEIKNLINKYKIQTEKYYANSPFEDITFLTNDELGKWGEELSHNILQQAQISSIWDGDSNTSQEDGVYDIKANNYRIEVKTATRGHNKNTSDNWQHENIYYNKVWDKLLFVDIAYYSIYFTILDYDNFFFERQHPVFNKKATLRTGQTDKWKFDFSRASIQKGVDAGLTFEYNSTTDNMTELSLFLQSHIKE